MRFGHAHARASFRPGEMNQLEKRYRDHLHLLRINGDVLWFKYNALKLRLAEKTFYIPDFAVVFSDYTIGIDEVKGHWEDDARVKIKVAAATYPFRFRAVTWDRQTQAWEYEIFN